MHNPAQSPAQSSPILGQTDLAPRLFDHMNYQPQSSFMFGLSDPASGIGPQATYPECCTPQTSYFDYSHFEQALNLQRNNISIQQDPTYFGLPLYFSPETQAANLQYGLSYLDEENTFNSVGNGRQQELPNSIIRPEQVQQQSRRSACSVGEMFVTSQTSLHNHQIQQSPQLQNHSHVQQGSLQLPPQTENLHIGVSQPPNKDRFVQHRLRLQNQSQRCLMTQPEPHSERGHVAQELHTQSSVLHQPTDDFQPVGSPAGSHTGHPRYTDKYSQLKRSIPPNASLAWCFVCNCIYSIGPNGLDCMSVGHVKFYNEYGYYPIKCYKHLQRWTLLPQQLEEPNFLTPSPDKSDEPSRKRSKGNPKGSSTCQIAPSPKPVAPTDGRWPTMITPTSAPQATASDALFSYGPQRIPSPKRDSIVFSGTPTPNGITPVFGQTLEPVEPSIGEMYSNLMLRSLSSEENLGEFQEQIRDLDRQIIQLLSGGGVDDGPTDELLLFENEILSVDYHQAIRDYEVEMQRETATNLQ